MWRPCPVTSNWEALQVSEDLGHPRWEATLNPALLHLLTSYARLTTEPLTCSTL